MTYKLILFDCDGTLVDSEHLNNLAVLETLHHFGVDRYDIHYALTHFVGLRFSKIIEIVAQKTSVAFPPEASKFYLQKVRELAPLHMRSIEGAVDVVQHTKTRAKIGVVSNGERNNVMLSLDFVGLKKYFEECNIFTGLMAPPKPAPDLYLLAAQTMGFTPHETLVIEDSSVGVMAGVAAGMTVWGFCGTHPAPEEQGRILKEKRAAHVFKTMAELQNALLSCFSAPNRP